MQGGAAESLGEHGAGECHGDGAAERPRDQGEAGVQRSPAQTELQQQVERQLESAQRGEERAHDGQAHDEAAFAEQSGVMTGCLLRRSEMTNSARAMIEPVIDR